MATWARGLDFKNSANNKRFGGVGLYGSDSSAQKVYLGFGAEPWNNQGLELTASTIKFKGTDVSLSNHNHDSVYAKTSGTYSGFKSGELQVKDIRDTAPSPDSLAGNKISAFFNNHSTYGGGWQSGISVGGWSSGYQVWQLSAGSNNTDSEHLYFRRGRGSTWGSLRRIYHEGNKPTLNELGAAPANHSHPMNANTFISNNFYNYANGVLIDFGITAALSTMVVVEVIGNGYGAGKPVSATFSFYDYTESGGIINCSGTSTGLPITMSVFRHGGRLKGWVNRTADFQTFSFRIMFGNVTTQTATFSNAGIPSSGVTHRIDITPVITTGAGGIEFYDGNTKLYRGNGNSLKIQTNSGNVEIGPMNTSHCHIYTDRPSVYFNKEVKVGANISSEGNNKTITFGTGPTDVFIMNSATNKYLQLKDDNRLCYSDNEVWHSGNFNPGSKFGGHCDTWNWGDFNWRLSNHHGLGSMTVVDGGDNQGIYQWGAGLTFGGPSSTCQIYHPHNGGIYWRGKWQSDIQRGFFEFYHTGNFNPTHTFNLDITHNVERQFKFQGPDTNLGYWANQQRVGLFDWWNNRDVYRYLAGGGTFNVYRSTTFENPVRFLSSVEGIRSINDVQTRTGVTYSSSRNEKENIIKIKNNKSKSNSIRDVLINGVKNTDLAAYNYKEKKLAFPTGDVEREVILEEERQKAIKSNIDFEDTYIGFIAEEVEEKMPDFMNLIGTSLINDDGEKEYRIREMSVTGALWTALQYALEEIDELKDSVKELLSQRHC